MNLTTFASLNFNVLTGGFTLKSEVSCSSDATLSKLPEYEVCECRSPGPSEIFSHKEL